MEKYIVAALTASLPKYEQCIVAKETDVINTTHTKVFGPDSKEVCDKWAAENCGKPAVETPIGDTKAVRPRVYTAEDLAADPRLRPDGYVQKIVKYVPSEIVAAYIALASYLQPVGADGKAAAAASDKPTWYVFWFLLVLSPIYIYFFTWEANKPRPIYQTIVAPFAFAAWVIAIEGPVAAFFRTQTGVQGIGMIVLIAVFLLILLGERVYEILTGKSQPAP